MVQCMCSSLDDSGFQFVLHYCGVETEKIKSFLHTYLTEGHFDGDTWRKKKHFKVLSMPLTHLMHEAHCQELFRLLTSACLSAKSHWRCLLDMPANI